MFPFLLIVGLFIFFTALGQAVLSALKVRFGVLWSWFLSPTLGMGITVLCVNAFSKWGHPIRTTGPWITLVLVLATIAVFIWRRPVFPRRQLLPFLAILGFFLLYMGWPMLRFGFKWISYGNDDMANYTLAAERFLNDSYYFLPEQTELEGTDYSQHFWFMHALQQIRPGSEMLLSWTCSITGLNPHQVFMPMIFALTLMQIFSLGALVVYKGRYRRHALVAMALLAISPLFALGTLYQLIAQVGGISLLICACSLMLRETRFSWNSILATGLLVASMGITYPEVSPFVALSIGLFALRLRYKNAAGFPVYAKRILWIAALTFLIMGINTYQFINTLILQSLGSAGLGAMADISQLDGLVLFPWTLVPSFLPMVFGLHAFGVVGSDPLLSICIALGIAMMAFLTVRALIGLWQGLPAAVLGVIMIPLGVFLFFKGQDFGLFKLGMFAQPVVAFFLAQAFLWLWQHHKRRATVIALFLYFAATVPSHFYYVRSSIGDIGGGLSEVVGASEKGVIFKLPPNQNIDAIESDITNVVSAKMLAMYTRGTDTRFLSRNYMDNVANIAPLEFLRNPDPEFGDSRSQMLRPLRFLRWMLPDELMKGHVAAYNMMAMHSIDNSWSETSFRHLNYQNPIFVSMQTKYDHFNKFASLIGEETGWHDQGVYVYKPLAEVKNRLIFTHSEKGPHYYSSARFRASFFQREPEPISDNKRYFHGTGRYSMFQVFNPVGNLRLVIDFSRTSLGGARSNLPNNAVIVGEDSYPINFVGYGSARVFSQPIKPQVFEGLSYLTVDFGEDGQMIFKDKTGLMSLYGIKYNLDDRRLVGFTRDISLVTEEQYQNLKRPTRISKFPDDLYENPGLEYSGLFEDGWLGEQAYFCLGESNKGDAITFKGTIPDLPEFRQNGVAMIMKINGQETEPIVLHVGNFTVNRFVNVPGRVTRIDLRFTKAETYGEVDSRLLTAFLNELTLAPVSDLTPVIQEDDRVGDSFRFNGIDTDGWAAKNVSFHLPPSTTPKVMELQLELPSWATGPSGNLAITLDGQQVFGDAATAGSYLTVKIPLAKLDEQIVGITAQSEFTLPGQDNKQRSYRVKKILLRDLADNERLDGNNVRTMPRYELTDVDGDGWTGRQAKLMVPSNTKAEVAEFELEFPGWASAATGKFVFTLNGKVVYSEELPHGQYKTVTVPLEPGVDNVLLLQASHEFSLPAPDQRVRSYRILKVEVK